MIDKVINDIQLDNIEVLDNSILVLYVDKEIIISEESMEDMEQLLNILESKFEVPTIVLPNEIQMEAEDIDDLIIYLTSLKNNMIKDNITDMYK